MTAVLLVVCLRDAVAWVGRPFAGLLFARNRIVVSIGRPSWRAPQLRRAEWARIVAVDGRPVDAAAAVHAAVAAVGTGREVTYTLRREAEVFRLVLPTRTFTWLDFGAVFAPMLGMGFCLVLLGSWLVALRPDLAEVRALFASCLAFGLVLITGPDQYGPYRFTPLAMLALAAAPPAIVQLAAAYPWAPGPWASRVVAGLYLGFAVVGGLLVAYFSDPAIFLPLLYLVYCAQANAFLLYAGSLVGALATRRRPRAQLVLALVAVVASSAAGVVVVVAYPLLVGPVSPSWMILPAGLMPLLSGIAFVALVPRRPAGEEAVA